MGTSDLAIECENLVADFVGKESAIVFSMVFLFPLKWSANSFVVQKIDLFLL